MKTRYIHRAMPEQRSILIWCYGVWFLLCLLSGTLAADEDFDTENSYVIASELVQDAADDQQNTIKQ